MEACSHERNSAKFGLARVSGSRGRESGHNEVDEDAGDR